MKYIKVIGTVVTLAVAGLSAVLSFSSLAMLASTAGIATPLNYLFPLIVDGTTIVGSLLLLRHAHETSWGPKSGSTHWRHMWLYGWLLILSGVGLSVWGNVMASAPDPLSRIVHAIPPVMFALTLEGFMMLQRAQARSRNTQPREEAAHTPVKPTPSGGEVIKSTAKAAPPARKETQAKAKSFEPKTGNGKEDGNSGDKSGDVTGIIIPGSLGAESTDAAKAVSSVDEKLQMALELIDQGIGVRNAASIAGVGVGRLSAHLKATRPDRQSPRPRAHASSL